MAKPPKNIVALNSVRTRRAYFDFNAGQLHVRTAFPTTGGFDEQVTLFCLHAADSSSRAFAHMLPVLADVRSVYAPDLPGCGESDPSPNSTITEAAGAVADLATDLRLRQIDVLGIASGALAALELAAAKPELVRRLVLVGVPATQRLAVVKQPALIIRTRLESTEMLARLKEVVPSGKPLDALDSGHDLFESAPAPLIKQLATFLGGRG